MQQLLAPMTLKNFFSVKRVINAICHHIWMHLTVKIRTLTINLRI